MNALIVINYFVARIAPYILRTRSHIPIITVMRPAVTPAENAKSDSIVGVALRGAIGLIKEPRRRRKRRGTSDYASGGWGDWGGVGTLLTR